MSILFTTLDDGSNLLPTGAPGSNEVGVDERIGIAIINGNEYTYARGRGNPFERIVAAKQLPDVSNRSLMEGVSATATARMDAYLETNPELKSAAVGRAPDPTEDGFAAEMSGVDFAAGKGAFIADGMRKSGTSQKPEKGTWDGFVRQQGIDLELAYLGFHQAALLRARNEGGMVWAPVLLSAAGNMLPGSAAGAMAEGLSEITRIAPLAPADVQAIEDQLKENEATEGRLRQERWEMQPDDAFSRFVRDATDSMFKSAGVSVGIGLSLVSRNPIPAQAALTLGVGNAIALGTMVAGHTGGEAVSAGHLESEQVYDLMALDFAAEAVPELVGGYVFGKILDRALGGVFKRTFMERIKDLGTIAGAKETGKQAIKVALSGAVSGGAEEVVTGAWQRLNRSGFGMESEPWGDIWREGLLGLVVGGVIGGITYAGVEGRYGRKSRQRARNEYYDAVADQIVVKWSIESFRQKLANAEAQHLQFLASEEAAQLEAHWNTHWEAGEFGESEKLARELRGLDRSTRAGVINRRVQAAVNRLQLAIIGMYRDPAGGGVEGRDATQALEGDLLRMFNGNGELVDEWVINNAHRFYFLPEALDGTQLEGWQPGKVLAPASTDLPINDYAHRQELTERLEQWGIRHLEYLRTAPKSEDDKEGNIFAGLVSVLGRERAMDLAKRHQLQGLYDVVESMDPFAVGAGTIEGSVLQGQPGDSVARVSPWFKEMLSMGGTTYEAEVLVDAMLGLSRSDPASGANVVTGDPWYALAPPKSGQNYQPGRRFERVRKTPPDDIPNDPPPDDDPSPDDDTPINGPVDEAVDNAGEWAPGSVTRIPESTADRHELVEQILAQLQSNEGIFYDLMNAQVERGLDASTPLPDIVDILQEQGLSEAESTLVYEYAVEESDYWADMHKDFNADREEKEDDIKNNPITDAERSALADEVLGATSYKDGTTLISVVKNTGKGYSILRRTPEAPGALGPVSIPTTSYDQENNDWVNRRPGATMTTYETAEAAQAILDKIATANNYPAADQAPPSTDEGLGDASADATGTVSEAHQARQAQDEQSQQFSDEYDTRPDLVETGRKSETYGTENPVVALPGNENVDVSYRVVSANDLVNSFDKGYYEAMQLRIESADPLRVGEMAANLNPARLGSSSEMVSGAPLVTRHGYAINNGRIQAVRVAHEKKNTKEYKKFLRDSGFDISGIKDPILVRVLNDRVSLDGASRMTDESNVNVAQALAPGEIAKLDGNRIHNEIEAGFVFRGTPDEMGVQFINLLGAEGNGLLNVQRDQMTQTGAVRWANAQMAYLFRGYEGSLLDQVTDKDTAATVVTAMQGIARGWFQLKQEIQQRGLAAEYDVSRAVIETYERGHPKGKDRKSANAMYKNIIQRDLVEDADGLEVSNARHEAQSIILMALFIQSAEPKAGKTADGAVQTDMTGNISNVEPEFTFRNDAGAKAREYADLVMGQSGASEQMDSLFSGMKAPGALQMLRAAFPEAVEAVRKLGIAEATVELPPPGPDELADETKKDDDPVAKRQDDIPVDAGGNPAALTEAQVENWVPGVIDHPILKDDPLYEDLADRIYDSYDDPLAYALQAAEDLGIHIERADVFDGGELEQFVKDWVVGKGYTAHEAEVVLGSFEGVDGQLDYTTETMADEAEAREFDASIQAVVDKVEEYAATGEWRVRAVSSGQSTSYYIYLTPTGENTAGGVKIRISDHDTPASAARHGEPDIFITTNEQQYPAQISLDEVDSELIPLIEEEIARQRTEEAEWEAGRSGASINPAVKTTVKSPAPRVEKPVAEVAAATERANPGLEPGALADMGFLSVRGGSEPYRIIVASALMDLDSAVGFGGRIGAGINLEIGDHHKNTYDTASNTLRVNGFTGSIAVAYGRYLARTMPRTDLAEFARHIKFAGMDQVEVENLIARAGKAIVAGTLPGGNAEARDISVLEQVVNEGWVTSAEEIFAVRGAINIIQARQAGRGANINTSDEQLFATAFELLVAERAMNAHPALIDTGRIESELDIYPKGEERQRWIAVVDARTNGEQNGGMPELNTTAFTDLMQRKAREMGFTDLDVTGDDLRNVAVFLELVKDTATEAPGDARREAAGRFWASHEAVSQSEAQREVEEDLVDREQPSSLAEFWAGREPVVEVREQTQAERVDALRTGGIINTDAGDRAENHRAIARKKLGAVLIYQMLNRPGVHIPYDLKEYVFVSILNPVWVGRDGVEGKGRRYMTAEAIPDLEWAFAQLDTRAIAIDWVRLKTTSPMSPEWAVESAAIREAMDAIRKQFKLGGFDVPILGKVSPEHYIKSRHSQKKLPSDPASLARTNIHPTGIDHLSSQGITDFYKALDGVSENNPGGLKLWGVPERNKREARKGQGSGTVVYDMKDSGAISREQVNLPPSTREVHRDGVVADAPAVIELDDHLKAHLAPHQQLAVKQIVATWEAGEHFFLRDDMGTGKTRTQFAAMYLYQQRNGVAGNVLYIAPESTLGNVRGLITQENVDDLGHSQAEAWRLFPVEQMFADGFKGVSDKFDKGTMEMDWDTVAVDEAHRMKNVGSKASMAINALSQKHLLLSTGTPFDKTSGVLGLLAKLTNQSEAQLLEALHLRQTTRLKYRQPHTFVENITGFTMIDTRAKLGALINLLDRQGKSIRHSIPMNATMDEVILPRSGAVEAMEGLDVNLIGMDVGGTIKPLNMAAIEASMDAQLAKLGPGKRKLAKQRMERYLSHLLKVSYTVDRAREILEADPNAQVVLVSENVGTVFDFGDIKVTHTMPEVLEAMLGEYAVARVFGRGSPNEEIARFQEDSSAVRVTILGMAKGAEGINLDDTRGNRPRTMLTLSVGWAADRYQQLLRRTDRMSSEGMATYEIVWIGGLEVDSRMRTLLAEKNQILRLTQLGEDVSKLTTPEAARASRQTINRSGVQATSRTIENAIVAMGLQSDAIQFEIAHAKDDTTVAETRQRDDGGWIITLYEGNLFDDGETSLGTSAREAILHEAVGHIGLRAVMGDKAAFRFTGRVLAWAADAEPAMIESITRHYGELTNGQLAEEVVARLAERLKGAQDRSRLGRKRMEVWETLVAGINARLPGALLSEGMIMRALAAAQFTAHGKTVTERDRRNRRTNALQKIGSLIRRNFTPSQGHPEFRTRSGQFTGNGHAYETMHSQLHTGALEKQSREVIQQAVLGRDINGALVDALAALKSITDSKAHKQAGEIMWQMGRMEIRVMQTLIDELLHHMGRRNIDLANLRGPWKVLDTIHFDDIRTWVAEKSGGTRINDILYLPPDMQDALENLHENRLDNEGEFTMAEQAKRGLAHLENAQIDTGAIRIIAELLEVWGNFGSYGAQQYSIYRNFKKWRNQKTDEQRLRAQLALMQGYYAADREGATEFLHIATMSLEQVRQRMGDLDELGAPGDSGSSYRERAGRKLSEIQRNARDSSITEPNKSGGINRDLLKPAKGYPEEVREWMGIIREPLDIVSQSLRRMGAYVNHIQYLQAVAGLSELSMEPTAGRSHEIRGAEDLWPLQGRYMSEGTEMLIGQTLAGQTALDRMRKYTRYISPIKTVMEAMQVLRLITAARNYASETGIGPPALHVKDLVKHAREYLRGHTARWKMLSGQEMTEQDRELIGAAFRQGILGETAIQGMSETGVTAGDGVKDKVFDVYRWFTEAPNLGTFAVERKANIEKGMTPEAAEDAAGEFLRPNLPLYGNLPPAIRVVNRIPLTLTYGLWWATGFFLPARQMGRAVKALARRGGDRRAVGTLIKTSLVGAWQIWFMHYLATVWIPALFGLPDDDEDRAGRDALMWALPGYYRGQANIVTGDGRVYPLTALQAFPMWGHFFQAAIEAAETGSFEPLENWRYEQFTRNIPSLPLKAMSDLHKNEDEYGQPIYREGMTLGEMLLSYFDWGMDVLMHPSVGAAYRKWRHDGAVGGMLAFLEDFILPKDYDLNIPQRVASRISGIRAKGQTIRDAEVESRLMRLVHSGEDAGSSIDGEGMLQTWISADLAAEDEKRDDEFTWRLVTVQEEMALGVEHTITLAKAAGMTSDEDIKGYGREVGLTNTQMTQGLRGDSRVEVTDPGRQKSVTEDNFIILEEAIVALLAMGDGERASADMLLRQISRMPYAFVRMIRDEDDPGKLAELLGRIATANQLDGESIMEGAGYGSGETDTGTGQ